MSPTRELSQTHLEAELAAAIDRLNALNLSYMQAEEGRARRKHERDLVVTKEMLVLQDRYRKSGVKQPAKDLLEAEARLAHSAACLDADLAEAVCRALSFEAQNLRQQMSACQTLLRPHFGGN